MLILGFNNCVTIDSSVPSFFWFLFAYSWSPHPPFSCQVSQHVSVPAVIPQLLHTITGALLFLECLVRLSKFLFFIWCWLLPILLRSSTSYFSFFTPCIAQTGLLECFITRAAAVYDIDLSPPPSEPLLIEKEFVVEWLKLGWLTSVIV